MLRRIFCIVLMGLALSGCVLQSKTPLIASDDGAPLFDAYGLTFATYTRTDGAWKKDADSLTFVRDGRHYAIREGSDVLDVAFRRISGNWWLIQATEPGTTIAYGLIDAQPDALYIHTLDCKTLKDSAAAAAEIDFDGDDCFLKPGADSQRLFAALAAAPGEPTSKLAPRR